MGKWIKNLLALGILGFLVWYLVKHWEQLGALLELKPLELFLIYLFCALGTINNSHINHQLLSTLEVKISFSEMILLQNATRLLNLLPMKFGTVFRGNYLKRRYGLSYSHYATFFMYSTFLMCMTACVTGFIGLATGYGFAGYENKILATLFLGVLIASLALLLMPLPIPAGTGKLSVIIRNFLHGRKVVSKNHRIILVCIMHFVVSLLSSAIRIGIIYQSIGQNLHFTGCLVLGTLGYTSLILSLTPGALGVRELVLASGAVVLGVPLEVGVLAAMFDRAVIFSWTFIVGGGCTIWLWHKYPGDWKNASKQVSESNDIQPSQ